MKTLKLLPLFVLFMILYLVTGDNFVTDRFAKFMDRRMNG